MYGGDQTNRIGQEILLGIGGVRLMRKLGVLSADTMVEVERAVKAWLALP